MTNVMVSYVTLWSVGDLSDFAYALIGVSNERTTQPHSRDGSEIGMFYFNKLIILPKTSRFVFHAYFISCREYVLI